MNKTHKSFTHAVVSKILGLILDILGLILDGENWSNIRPVSIFQLNFYQTCKLRTDTEPSPESLQ